MAVITAPKGQSAHWYHKDGTPQHSVPLAKGDGDRPTNLADARKLGLYPSVSGIIGILDKPGLITWKLKQMVEFALRTPRKPEVSDSHYFNMVKDAAFQQVDDAADFGTAIHAEIEKFLLWDFTTNPVYSAPLELEDYVRPTINWMLSKKIKILDPEKVLVNHVHGFAGTSDAPYRAEKSFGILDYKTNKTKPGKPIAEWPEKLLQISAYFATYWGEPALDNPQAWGGNIYISSTEKRRTEAKMYNYEMLKQGWEVFKMLCHIWRHFNEYDPRQPPTLQPKWTQSISIEIASPLNSSQQSDAKPAAVTASDSSPLNVPAVTAPALPPSESPNSNDDPAVAILQAQQVIQEVDGIKFLNPRVCKEWRKESVPSIYSWWYHPGENKAKVGFSADGALIQIGWLRCFKAYVADLDTENRAAGKPDPVVGTSGLPVKPAVVTPGPKITKEDLKDMSVKPTVAPAPTGSPERISQLERMKMGFGKHRNDTLVAVPASYFIWCLGEMARGAFKGPEHVREYLEIDSVVKALDAEASQ